MYWNSVKFTLNNEIGMSSLLVTNSLKFLSFHSKTNCSANAEVICWSQETGGVFAEIFHININLTRNLAKFSSFLNPEQWSNSVGEVHYSPIGDMKKHYPLFSRQHESAVGNGSDAPSWPPPLLAICLTRQTERKGSWWSGGEAGRQVSDGMPAEQAAPANKQPS